MSLKFLKQSSFDNYAAFLKSTNLPKSSIKRKLSSLSSFQKFLSDKGILSKNIDYSTNSNPSLALPKKDTFFRRYLDQITSEFKQLHPQNIKNWQFSQYLILTSILIIFTGLGFGLYRQAITRAKTNLAYSTAASPVYANRFLSFQGRLTDSFGVPITSSTPIVFELYNTPNVGEGTTLYSSAIGNSQTVTPDDNGIFAVTIGQSHGNMIPDSVFTQNSAVYLQITAGGETMSPRQPIATVAYAINAETLQGLPPSASGTKDTVLVIDGDGNLNLGETSPTIKSTSGTMGVEGQAILIKASDSSGGNIEINPDSNGIIKLTTEGSSPSNGGGFIDLTNANLSSGNLLNADIRNTNRNYNFIDLNNYDIATTVLVTRFSVDAYGNTQIGGTMNASTISIDNTTVSSSADELNLLVGTTATNGSILYGNGSNISNLNIGNSGYILMSDGTLPVWINSASLSTGTTYAAGVGLSLSPSNVFSVDYDSTLTLAGNKLALNLGSTNTWTALQTFNNGISVNGDITSTGIIRNVTVGTTVSTAAATAAKTATISNYTLTPGDLLSVYFASGNTVATATLNINGTGAKNIRLNNSNVTTTNFTLTAGAVVLMYYDGTYFQIMGSQRTTDTDTDNYDRMYWGNSITAGDAIYDYKLVMQASNGKWYPLTLQEGTGTTKTVSTQEFTINSPILYYATTTNIAANGTLSNVYSEIATTYLNYTSNTASWTSQLPIYLKGTISSSGNFVLDNTSPTSFMTQSLPISEDGFVYILLGQMYSTTGIRLFQYHPIYEYHNGKVQLYNPNYNDFLLKTGGTVTGNLSIGGTLNLSQGAHNGYILASDPTGNAAWMSLSDIGVTSYTASNGLTLDGSVFKLGGTLTQNTQIGTSSFGLTFTGENNSPALHIGSSGFIGIGTSNPNSKLEIQQNSDGVSGGILLSNTLGDSKGNIYKNGSTLILGNDGDNAFSITNGNVGIGYSASSYKFHVNGDSYLSTNLTIGGTFISVGSTNNVSNLSADYLDNHSSEYFINVGQTASFPYVNNATDTTLTRNGTGPFTLGLNLGSTNTWTAKQTFTSGIGITGNSTFTNNLTIGGTFVSVGSTNTVTNLSADLLDGYNSSTFIQVGYTGYFNTASNGLQAISKTVVGLGGTLTQNTQIGTSSFSLSFLGLGNTQSLYIAPSGYVGIGTTNPTNPFTVTGNTLLNNNLTIGGTFVSVGSTNTVTNLSADLLDGYHLSNFPYVNNATDTTLTRNGTGPFTLGLNLGSTNTWTAIQNFSAGATVSNLNSTNNISIGGTLIIPVGAQDNYILSSDASGNASWTSLSDIGVTSYTASNGLTLDGSVFKLGGTLTQNTQIGTSSFSLSFLGLGNTQSLYIAPSGYVGIGTTNPLAQFQIEKTANGSDPLSFYLVNSGTSAGTANSLNFSLGGSTSGKITNIIDVGGTSASLTFSTFYNGSNREVMRFYNGNVAIGNSSPLYKLDVSGTARFTGNLFANDNLVVGGTFVSVGSTNLVTNLNANYLNGLNSSAFLQIGQTGSLPYVNNATDTTLTRNGTGPFTLGLNLGSTNTWTAKQTFTSGIGITGNSTFTNNLTIGSTLILTNGAQGGYILTSDASGNSYWAPNTAVGTTYVATNGLTLNGYSFKLGGTLTQNTQIGTSSFGLSFVGENNNTALHIDSNGFVGIGTTNPNGVLAVNNTAVTTGSELVTNGTFTGNANGWNLNNAVYNINNVVVTGDNAGVGTSISVVSGKTYLVSFTLSDVSSNTLISSFFDNITFDSAPLFKNGNNSFAFTSDFTGDDTIFIMTAIGDTASTWTIDNVSIKETSISPSLVVTDYDGSNILSLGGDTLNNTAFGISSFKTNTSGYSNEAFGAYSLSSNTDGSYNNAFGSYSLLSNTTGFGNAAIGSVSLLRNTEGNMNMAVGYGSLWNNTTGSGNSAFGPSSLENLKSGDYNVAIGLQSGSGLESGSGNIFIGSQGVGGTYDNSLYIGGLSNQTPIIFGDLSNNYLSVGTTASGYALNVGGTINAASFFQNGVPIGTGAGTIMPSNGLTNIGSTSVIGLGGTLTQNTQIGTSSFSLSLMSSSTAPVMKFLNNDSSTNFEIRTGSSDLYNIFLGLNVGVSNTTGEGNNAFGGLALSNNTVGNYNNAFGYGALMKNQDGEGNNAFGIYTLSNNTSGDLNSAFGYRAMYQNTTGSFNSAIGYESMRYNQSGEYNTSIGSGALFRNTTGSYNATIGFAALNSGTTLSNNVAIGSGAGYNLSVGSSNIFIGNNNGDSGSYSNRLYIGNDSNPPLIFGDLANKYLSIGTTIANSSLTISGSGNTGPVITLLNGNNTVGLEIRTDLNNLNNSFVGIGVGKTNTTGINNSGFGFQALASNIGGSGNSAMGYQSLGSNTSGSSNNAFGFWSLVLNNSGRNNNAFGSGSLYSNTTGSNNVAIGNFSLSTGSTITSNIAVGHYAGSNLSVGSSNIFIGNNNGDSGSYSNRLYIGNNQNPVIYGDLSNGYIGLGTTNPTARLQVGGNIYPSANLSYDIGSSSLRWNTAWIKTVNIGSSTWSLQSPDNSRFSLFNNSTGGTEVLTLLNNGNLGLGTTNPINKLSIIGNGSVSTSFGIGTSLSVGTNLSVGGTLVLTNGAQDGYILTSDASGNAYWAVGVGSSGGGSASPTNGLQIIGENIGLGGTLTQDTQINTSSYNLSFLGLGNTQSLYISSSGRIGVGNTNPIVPFEVSNINTAVIGTGSTRSITNLSLITTGSIASAKYYDNDNPYYSLSLGNSDSTKNSLGLSGTGSIKFNTNDSGASPTYLGNGAASRIQGFSTGLSLDTGTTTVGGSAITWNNSQIFLRYNNRVGIGTSNPNAPLEVGLTASSSIGNTASPITVNNLSATFKGSIASTKYYDINDPNYFLTIANSDPLKNSLSLSGTGSIKFNVNDTGSTATYLGNGAASRIQTFTNGMSLDTGTTNVSGNTIDWNSQLFLATNGYVGIGTTSPTGKLEIKGDDLKVLASTNDTTAPNAKFELELTGISNSPVGAMQLYAPTGAGSEYLRFNIKDSAGAMHADSLVISRLGYVGIGTTNPSTYLHIGGTLDTSPTTHGLLVLGQIDGSNISIDQNEIMARNVGSTSPLYLNNEGGNIITGSGYVGIGNGSPSYKLDVTGTGRFSSTANPGLVVGNGSVGYAQVGSAGWYDDGSYLSPLGTRPFYIRSNIANSYIYSPNIYLGYTTGTTVSLRGNTINGDSWSMTGAGTLSLGGDITFTAVNEIRNPTTSQPSIKIGNSYSTGTTAVGSLIFRDYFNSANSAQVNNLRTIGRGAWSIGVAPYAGDNLFVSYIDQGNNAYWGYVESSPSSLDLAEVYPVVDEYLDSNRNPTIEKGAIVCRSTTDNAKITKCTKSNDSKLVGAITTKPSDVMGMDHLLENSKDHEKAQIALTGRVPVIATSKNGQFDIGDPVTSSTLAGFGQKSTAAGMVIGTALEASDWNDQRCPIVSSIDNIPWPEYPDYDPQHRAALNTDKPCFKLPNGMYIGKIMVFTNTSYYDPDINLVSTGQVNVDYNLDESLLASLGYENAKNGIESSVFSLNDSLGNLVTRISQFSEIASAKIKAGLVNTTNLIAKNIIGEKIISQEIISPKATIDELTSQKINTDKLVSQYIQTNEITADTATITGTLVANDIQTTQVTADVIDTDQLTANEATVSTLYADNIISKEGSIGDLMTAKISSLREEMKDIISKKVSTPSAIMAQSNDWSAYIASDSAKIDGDLALSNNLIVGSQLLVNGDTQLGNAFITGTFTAGEIAIKDNFIETTNTALYIQPSGTGSVHIMGDSLVIAENGDVNIATNLNVHGSLFGNLIKANEIETNKLTSKEIISDKLQISTDSASTIIASSDPIELATSSAKMTSNATAGTGTLPAFKNELVISTNKLTPSSMVYITPTGSTQNQVLYVKNKVTDISEPYFTVAFDQPLDQDISFNWWIIN